MKYWKKIKALVLILIFLGSAWVTVPQFVPKPVLEKAPAWLQDLLYDKQINLGLDLKGGLYLVLGLDIHRVLEETLRREIDMIRQGLKKENIEVSDPTFSIEKDFHVAKLPFPSHDAKVKADAYLAKNFPNLVIHFEEENIFYIRLLEQETKDIRDKTINQSIETLRNRIDEFGVKEPIISKASVDRIQIQFPGLTEIERIKGIIQRTAMLEFRIVSDALSSAAISALVTEAKNKGVVFEERSGMSLSAYTQKLNAQVKDSLPKGTLIRFQKQIDERTQEVSFIPFLVEDQARLTGYHLQDARVGIDQENQLPVVNLSFNPQGATLLKDITSANVGKLMAIILDDNINSAPQIRTAIPNGNAQITLGRFSDYSQLMKEASDLVIVLRAGSLPTTLEILEERTIGPSLGTDSIRSGTFATLLGGGLTVLFMLICYAASGFLASFALLYNVLLLLALLTLIGATLTLPGIAGIVLTLGMSVDANIIIFERIKESLRRGRSVLSAVMDGYEKAWSAILDSNLTTIFSGIVLLQYGTGPIKGFAVTLILGILTSIFTAYYISRETSALIYNNPNRQKISIGISLKKHETQTPVHYPSTPPQPPSSASFSEKR